MERTTLKNVVVTGASSGIGWGTVKVLTGKGFHVFATVRKQSDADSIAREFGAGATPVLMDVTDKQQVQSAAAFVEQRLAGGSLAGLVNNAGIAVPGPLLHLEIAKFRHQLEVNLISPVIVIQAFSRLLGATRQFKLQPGRIVNISSVAGKLGAPFCGPYVASKHGLEGLSESLRRELLLYGIDVIVIAPGSVVTPIWDKGESEDLTSFDNTDFGPILRKFRDYFISEGRKGLPPTRIGEAVYTALTARKPKTRYAVVPKPFQNWTLPRLLPKRTLDRLIGSRLGLIKT